MANRKIQYKLL